MRKFVMLMACLATIAVTAAPADAVRNPKPRVQILGVSGPEMNFDGEWEHIIEIQAYDPDGIITEVTVQFGDRSIAFAHTYCVIFGPGEVARMRIGHTYARSGWYNVRAWAVSVPECSEWGFEHHQKSPPDVERLRIDG